MQRFNFRKTLSATVRVTGPVMASSASAQPHSGDGMGSSMMNGDGGAWMSGGYGGILLLMFLVIVIAGLVAWIAMRKRP